MIEKFFRKAKDVNQLKTISFGSSIEEFAEYLHNQGAASHTIQYYLRVAGHFSYWLKTKHISLHSVNEAIVDKFLFKHLKRCSCPVRIGSRFIKLSRPALKLFLKVLRDHHLIPLPPKPIPPPVSPTDKLLTDFKEYLEKVRGIRQSTINWHLNFIRQFLKAKYRDGPIDLRRLNAIEIREYVVTKAPAYKPKSLALLATSLRVFFRFLRVTNQIEQPLENAIPNVVPHGRTKLSTIPEYLTEEQLQRLLSSFNLSTRTGLRDRAITLMIARLGIRGRDVANLHLEDINWRQGIIQLRKTKSRRTSSLPLLKEVGEALVAYLRKGRPHSQARHVFLTHCLPVGRPLSTDGVRDVMRQAFRSTLSMTGGPRILRHTLATHLLQKSAKLKEIADVLGHCSIETTNIYAKVDLKRLAEVALPWPEVKP